jgi:hypothetical protein
MCFGGGGGSSSQQQQAAAPVTPDPGAVASTETWSERRRNQNRIQNTNAGVGQMNPQTGANNDNGPTTALKKLMGA